MMKHFQNQNHYDMLEVAPHATDQEIREAFERLKQVYTPNSPGVHDLFTPEELNVIRSQVEEAYRVLSDPRYRLEYDLMLQGEGEVMAVPPQTPYIPQRRITAEELRELLGGEDVLFSGKDLRAVREYLSLDLEQVVRETKIRKGILRAIEDEDTTILPAPVYLKGFSKAYAKTLGLDPNNVVTGYMEAIVRKGYQGK